MQPKVTFLAEAAKAIAETQAVLSFFDREPERSDEWDLRPFADALLTLCRDRRRDTTGVASFREFVEVFDLVRPPFHPVTDEQLKGGIGSISSYRQWVRDTFPEAQARPDKN